jgi:hypothetical protein
VKQYDPDGFFVSQTNAPIDTTMPIEDPNSAQVPGPAGIAVDTDGKVYVSSTFKDSIYVLANKNSTGAYQLVPVMVNHDNSSATPNIPKVIAGSTAGFSKPRGLTFDSARVLHVSGRLNDGIKPESDITSSSVMRFKTDGSFQGIDASARLPGQDMLARLSDHLFYRWDGANGVALQPSHAAVFVSVWGRNKIVRVGTSGNTLIEELPAPPTTMPLSKPGAMVLSTLPN